MAYQIKCDNFLLHDPRSENLIVKSPKCKLVVNTVGEASFTIFSNHKNFDKLSKLRSVFEITQDGEAIFRGRMTDDSKDFHNKKKVDLEGAMAYFNDTMMRPFTFPDDFLDDAEYKAAAAESSEQAAIDGGVVRFFLKHVIDNHNSQVQPFQRFKLGRVTVFDKNNFIERSDTSYKKSWEILKEKLFESSLGGYLCIRYERDGNYIDYLADFDSVNDQKIVFGENLLDLLIESDASETYSAIIPLGADAEMKAGENYEGDYVEIENTTVKKLTLEDMPDGDITDDIVKQGDTLYSKKAVQSFGWIYAPVSETTWDDVETGESLQQHGVDFLEKKATKFLETSTINAVDLHLADSEIEAFRIYKKVCIESAPHGLSETDNLSELDIDIENPQNTKITVGETKRVFTDKTNSTNKKVDSVQKNADKANLDLSKKVDSVQKDVSGKVDKVDNDQIVKMLNESLNPVELIDRLVISNQKFGMDDDGTIHASGGEIAGFEFDEEGLKKSTTEREEVDGGQRITIRGFNVAPGFLETSESEYAGIYEAGILPLNMKSTKISNGALEVSRSDPLATMFGGNLSFMTVTINNTTYKLFIDPDTLSVVVKKEE